MKTFRILAFVTMCFVASCALSAQEGHGGEPERVIGVVHGDIADSSPLAKLTLTQPNTPFKSGAHVKIEDVLENTSDLNLTLIGPVAVEDVRDSAGQIAPETHFGCGFHFFSPCFHNKGQTFDASTLASHAKESGYDDLSQEYDLTTPGVYTVVAYVCGIRENKGCFRTNTIKITVEPR